jgi:hypothetical protein
MVRNIIITILVLLILVGCKPTQVNFSAKDITAEYVKKLLVTAETKSVPIKEDTAFTSYSVFVAELKEQLTNRDGIAEETILNKKSKNPGSGVAIRGSSYQLFIVTANNSAQPSIFLPAIFNAEGDCIGLGPALVGTWGAGSITFNRRIRCKPNRKTKEAVWIYPVKENEFGKTGEILDPKDDNTGSKIQIRFEGDTKKNISSLADFKIVSIYKISPNRFGGNKPLVFNIAEIFEDDHALYFKLLTSF